NPINLARLLSLAGKRPGDEQEGDGSGDDRRPHAPVSKPIAHGHPRDLKPTVRIVMVVPPLCPTCCSAAGQDDGRTGAALAAVRSNKGLALDLREQYSKVFPQKK